MSPDAEGLHAIANTSNPERRADIVFIHGLGGSSHKTWRYGKEGKDGHFFWPEELATELSDCGVWSIGYAAGITGLGNPGMIIEKRAGNIASQLILSDIGQRPIVFVTHSMGGLVVKALIVASQLTSDPNRKELVENIRGVVFCGTPHRGSSFASAAGVLGKFLGGSQGYVKEMEANAEPLDLLHDHFLAWHRDHPIPVESYAESIGLYRKRWFRRPLPLGLVVSRTSANPGIGILHDVDADHLSLVKPAPVVPAIHNLVYGGVMRFIEGALAARPAASTSVFTGSDNASAKPDDSQADTSRIDKYAPAELMGREAETRLLEKTWTKVFVSYGWGGESENLVDEIQHSLARRGIAIDRDKDRLPYGGSIREFMQTLSAGQAVIVVLSDKYLKSENCMYELLEIEKHGELRERVFPLVLPDADIYDATRRLEYVAYWGEKKKELESNIRELEDLEFIQGATRDLDLYADIRRRVSWLADTMKDMNPLTVQIHRESDFSDLAEAIVGQIGLAVVHDDAGGPNGGGEPNERDRGLSDEEQAEILAIHNPKNLQLRCERDLRASRLAAAELAAERLVELTAGKRCYDRERAAGLKCLGDAYSLQGREDEARTQWRRCRLVWQRLGEIREVEEVDERTARQSG